jgi:hypothetical protein
MALRRPTLLGAGRVAATRRPARRTAVRVVPAGRWRRGVCGDRVGGAWELPPQPYIAARRRSCVVAAGPCRGLGMQVSVDTIRTCSFSSFPSVQNYPPNLVCCVQEAVEQTGVEGERGRREDIELLIATGTSRGTTGISECPPFTAYSSFSFCLSVYAQGCVLCTGVWVEASACVWQRGCLSSRRSATPTRRRSWRGQVALAATQLHLNSSFPLRLLRLPNSMLCVVVCVERSACV